MANRIVPWQQGELDCLCGAYAVVNAVQCAVDPMVLTQDDCQELFNRIIAELAKRAKLVTAVTYGLDRTTLSAALRICDAWLDETRSCRLRARWPLYRMARASVADALATIAQHLSAPHGVAIISVDGALDHWTVVTAIEANRVQLCDSIGRRFIMRQSFIGTDASPPRYTLYPTAMVLLRVDSNA